MQKWLRKYKGHTSKLARRTHKEPKDLEPEVQDVLEVALEDLVSSTRSLCVSKLEQCESPIERLFMAAILLRHMTRLPPEGWKAQVEVGPYRVDFVHTFQMFKDQKEYMVAVELDGHDFHEKTKAQAKRDKQKDRYLMSQGYYVMRFTGSEVWNDPLACVNEVEGFAYEKWFADYGHLI